MSIHLKPLLVLVACLSLDHALGDDDYRWQDEIQFSEIPIVNRPAGNTFGSDHLADIWTHAKRQERPPMNPSTCGHETKHFLQNEQQRPGKNFIYREEGRGVYYNQTKTRNELSRYLPSGARKIADFRFRTYNAQCSSWHDALGCYFDEFSAYVSTSQIAIEMVQAEQYKEGGQDAVDGSMDFLYFASAMMLATDKAYPQELSNNPQLKAVFAMLAESAVYYIKIGLRMQQFNQFHAAKLLDHFLNSPENAAIRDFLKKTYGSFWIDRVFYSEPLGSYTLE